MPPVDSLSPQPAAAKDSFEKTTKLRSGQWLFMEERKVAYERARAASPGARAAEAGKAYWEGFRPALQAGDMERAAQLACEFLATQPTDRLCLAKNSVPIIPAAFR